MQASIKELKCNIWRH